MGKNILIFSDGTGQAGGLAPEQRLSNVYKLYRAARIGPDSPIDPAKQVAFYDPGLGTQEEGGPLRLRLWDALGKMTSSATGDGFSTNVIDCYEAILKHYEPGDRIYLFGFSRGAYTVRCVGGVMNLCGVATRLPDGSHIPRHGRALRAIAEEAVNKVYEHGAGKDRAKYEPEREEQARRFRVKYGSDDAGRANVVPHFIGVFDTVASLGATGVRRIVMLLALLLVMAVTAGVVAAPFLFLGRAHFLAAFGAGLGIIAFALALKAVSAKFKLIRGFPSAGSVRWHFASWRLRFYDRFLDKRVQYGRHALAIDETRRDFARVPWGRKGDAPERAHGQPEWLQQIWFAGNHSDIGGSYPEDESRLSDIALQWMVEEATGIPDPIVLDRSKLHLFPSPDGMQHSEAEALLDRYPSWFPRRWRRGWSEVPRVEARGAPLHESVTKRFRLPGVLHCGRYAPYRPETLRLDERVGAYYTENRDGRSID